MKNIFPPTNQNYTYLQTNRSDDLGSMWSSWNLDFQTNLGALRLAQKLVQNTSSSNNSNLGVPCAFEFFSGQWWSICDTTIFTNASPDIKQAFAEDLSGYFVGDSTTQFDVTNPGGDNYTYTWDTTGTNPNITALTFPAGATVIITGTNLAVGNRGTFQVNASGANFFTVANASGVVESNKTLGTGSMRVAGGTASHAYNFAYSDLEFFNGRLWSTTNVTLYSKSTISGGWTARDTLGSDVLHKLEYFKKFNRLYYTNAADTISSIDETDAIADPGSDYAIDLTNSIGQITTLAASSTYMWIGTIQAQNTSSDSGTIGSVLAWDGFSAQVTSEYLLQTAGVIGMVVIEDIPYAMDTEGRILKFTGTGFSELGRLPIDRILLLGSTYTSGGEASGRFMHFNGMQATKNNTILVMVKNPNEDGETTISENLPSGIWEFDLATKNFTHRYSAVLKTLASSTVTDYGQNRIKIAGAIKLNTMAANTIASDPGRSTILAGAKIFTDATTLKSAIFIDSPAKPTTDTEGQKRGYFVTTWFNSQEIQDKWTRLWTTFRKFMTSTDKMIFKYRIVEEAPIYATITWAGDRVFTTTTDVTAYAPTAAGFNGTTGGEVEVTQGQGSGSCTHISSVAFDSGTYTVTLDDSVIPGAPSGTAVARFQKWIKLTPEVTGQVKSYAQMGIAASNVRIQLKGVLEWTGDIEFYKMAIVSNEDIKINL